MAYESPPKRRTKTQRTERNHVCLGGECRDLILRSTIVNRLFLFVGLLLLVADLSAQDRNRILVGPNILVSWQLDGTHWEFLDAADPTNPKNLLGTGTLNRANSREGGEETRTYFSHDGGYTWKTNVYPELAAAPSSGDPQVAYGRSGTGYFVTLGPDPKRPKAAQALLFYRSEDGGESWGNVTYLPYGDHEQMVVDLSSSPFAGNVYISGLYGEKQYQVGVMRSIDDGKTWSDFVEVANVSKLPGRGLNGSVAPLVFSDGELFMPFHEFPVPLSTDVDGGKYHYWFSTSRDGGLTFSSPKKLTDREGEEIPGPFNCSPFYAIDRSHGPYRDRIYVSWMNRSYEPNLASASGYMDGVKDLGPARVMISYSPDRGKTWSKPKMVSPGNVGDQYWVPSIAVNNEGTVAISYYDTRGTPAGHNGVLVNRYITASVDGGETFLPTVRVSSVPTDSAPKGAVGVNMTRTREGQFDRDFVGLVKSGAPAGNDYLGLTADSEGTFHDMWEDGRTGSSQIWTAAVRVERLDRAKVAQTPTPRDLVEADISDRVQSVLMAPLRLLPFAGTAELSIGLKNNSEQSIFGPIKLEVVRHWPEDATILNASNGKSGVGAVFDYTHAIGDFESLPTGGFTEGIVWRIKVFPSENLSMVLKATGMVEKKKSSEAQ